MDTSILFLIVLVVIGYLYLSMRTCKEGFGEPIPTGELRKPCKSSVILDQAML